MLITAKKIRKKNGRTDQTAIFEQHFPRGIDSDDPEQMEAVGRLGLDTLWLAKEFKLTGWFYEYYHDGTLMVNAYYIKGKLHKFMLLRVLLNIKEE